MQDRIQSSEPNLGSYQREGVLGQSGPQRRQGRYWILTIRYADWSVPDQLPSLLAYIHGQQELGIGDSTAPYHHWQLFCVSKRKLTIHQVKSCFTNTAHCELTRSEAAEDYCLKDETAIDGTRFELGIKPFKRNCELDWERVWQLAVDGNIMGIPASLRVQHYSSLRKIGADFACPEAVERTVYVYWGRTGTGKSRRAWMEAGINAYSKDPRSKFFNGYRGEEHAILDEFRGAIDISHFLRWLDRYPVHVDLKGYSGPLKVRKWWITSNVRPDSWFPDLDAATLDAMMRRFTIVEEFE